MLTSHAVFRDGRRPRSESNSQGTSGENTGQASGRRFYKWRDGRRL